MKINWDYHIHTTFSDGQNSVDEIAKFCMEIGLQEIAITDHVRKNITYNFSDLLTEIDHAEQKYGIKIWHSAEAKILQNGQLDISDQILNKTDFIIGSIHSWPENISFEMGYKLLCESPCTIIGHVKFLNEKLIKLFIKKKKILEINNQYQLLEKELALIKKFPDLKISFGSNSHDTSQLKPAQKYFQHIANTYCHENQIWKITP